MVLKRILPLVSLALLPFYAEAQWMNKGIGNNISANMTHFERDVNEGVPLEDIEEHLNKYHGGINTIETNRPRFGGEFYKIYLANDGTIATHLGISKEGFVPNIFYPRFNFEYITKQKSAMEK